MRKVNSKLVGAFVLGAIALFMAAIIVFGKGHFFRPTLPVVMYFTGSVKGLQAGSAITFRGVTVGQVNDIELQYDAKNGQIYLPVFAEIYGDVLSIIGASQADGGSVFGHGKLLKKFIERGMRAQLSLPNFVTNQVNVTLDFFPDQPATLVKPIPDHTIEIPTVPSPIQEVSATLENVFKKHQRAAPRSTGQRHALADARRRQAGQRPAAFGNHRQRQSDDGRRQAGDARRRCQTRADPQQRGQDVGDGAGDTCRSKAAPRRGEGDDAKAGRHAFGGTDHHEEDRRARRVRPAVCSPRDLR